jgi:hypothetical protein
MMLIRILVLVTATVSLSGCDRVDIGPGKKGGEKSALSLRNERTDKATLRDSLASVPSSAHQGGDRHVAYLLDLAGPVEARSASARLPRAAWSVAGPHRRIYVYGASGVSPPSHRAA